MNCLLIDSGNSRIKWGWGSDYGAEAVCAVERDNIGQIPALWSVLPAPAHIWMTNSAGEERLQWLQQQFFELWGRRAELAVTGRRWEGLTNGYRNPQQLGVDRWLGMVAAWRRMKSSFCLIDCGTAVTIDFVDATGQHQGGNILPGLGATMEQLLQRAPHLRMGYLERKGILLGRSTAEALISAENGAQEVINSVLMKVQQHFGEAVLVVTGGDADRLQLEYPFQQLDGLVLEGLFQLFRDKTVGFSTD